MKTQINIAELLKDCPKGTKLYSPLCGECYFDRLNFGTIICKKQNTQEITFTSKGYYMLPVFDDCECMIFPSKDQRDWNKFVPPYKFKDGDVCYIQDVFGQEWYSIIKKCENDKLYTYVDIGISDNSFYCEASEGVCYCKDIIEHRLVTEDEKAKLFQSIKYNGYRWNPETKTLEILIKPKFKVGDIIIKRDSIENSWIVSSVGSEYYGLKTPNGSECIGIMSIAEQDEYVLVPNKFDTTTLVPFESRVLVRCSNDGLWKPAVFGFRNGYNNNAFYMVGGNCWKQCIPYLNNEHLCGTTNDCEEYYKTW